MDGSDHIKVWEKKLVECNININDILEKIVETVSVPSIYIGTRNASQAYELMKIILSKYGDSMKTYNKLDCLVKDIKKLIDQE